MYLCICVNIVEHRLNLPSPCDQYILWKVLETNWKLARYRGKVGRHCPQVPLWGEGRACTWNLQFLEIFWCLGQDFCYPETNVHLFCPITYDVRVLLKWRQLSWELTVQLAKDVQKLRPAVDSQVNNPFTPKSDQFQISPAASPEILCHRVWRTWLFITYSDEPSNSHWKNILFGSIQVSGDAPTLPWVRSKFWVGAGLGLGFPKGRGGWICPQKPGLILHFELGSERVEQCHEGFIPHCQQPKLVHTRSCVYLGLLSTSLVKL